MNLLEIFSQTPTGYRTEKDDKSVMNFRDARKTRLTLAHLNKLRIMNDVRQYEHEKKVEAVKKQYAAPSQDSSGGMGM